MTVIPLPPLSVPCTSVTVTIYDLIHLPPKPVPCSSVTVIIDDRDTFATLVRALFECGGNY